MSRRTRLLAASSVLLGSGLLLAPGPAWAQDVAAQWQSLPPLVRACMEGYAGREGATLNDFIARGIGPSYDPIAPYVQSCALFDIRLSEYSCEVDSGAGMIQTTCRDVFTDLPGPGADGLYHPIPFEDALAIFLTGKTVYTAYVETEAARDARLAEAAVANEVDEDDPDAFPMMTPPTATPSVPVPAVASETGASALPDVSIPDKATPFDYNFAALQAVCATGSPPPEMAAFHATRQKTVEAFDWKMRHPTEQGTPAFTAVNDELIRNSRQIYAVARHLVGDGRSDCASVSTLISVAVRTVIDGAFGEAFDYAEMMARTNDALRLDPLNPYALQARIELRYFFGIYDRHKDSPASVADFERLLQDLAVVEEDSPEHPRNEFIRASTLGWLNRRDDAIRVATALAAMSDTPYSQAGTNLLADLAKKPKATSAPAQQPRVTVGFMCIDPMGFRQQNLAWNLIDYDPQTFGLVITSAVFAEFCTSTSFPMNYEKFLQYQDKTETSPGNWVVNTDSTTSMGVYVR